MRGSKNLKTGNNCRRCNVTPFSLRTKPGFRSTENEKCCDDAESKAAATFSFGSLASLNNATIICSSLSSSPEYYHK